MIIIWILERARLSSGVRWRRRHPFACTLTNPYEHVHTHYVIAYSLCMMYIFSAAALRQLQLALKQHQPAASRFQWSFAWYDHSCNESVDRKCSEASTRLACCARAVRYPSHSDDMPTYDQPHANYLTYAYYRLFATCLCVRACILCLFLSCSAFEKEKGKTLSSSGGPTRSKSGTLLESTSSNTSNSSTHMLTPTKTHSGSSIETSSPPLSSSSSSSIPRYPSSLQSAPTHVRGDAAPSSPTLTPPSKSYSKTRVHAHLKVILRLWRHFSMYTQVRVWPWKYESASMQLVIHVGTKWRRCEHRSECYRVSVTHVTHFQKLLYFLMLFI